MPLTCPELCSFKEVCKQSFWRDIFSEIACSVFLVMTVTFALVTLNSQIYTLSTTHVGLMVGFNIYLLIEAYGPISGAHMNPVVTFAFLLCGRISFIRALFYTIAQCIGGVLGSAIVYGLCPASLLGEFGPFLPAPGLGAVKGMLVELIFTYGLIYTCLSTTCDSIRTVSLPSLPTAFCVGVAIMSVGTWTGACLNPIVALGPAVISKNFKDHWVYWVGAYAGAAIAVVVFRVFLITKDKPGNDSDKESKKTDEERQGILKEEITSLVEKVMALSVQYQNNVSPGNMFTEHKGSQNNISSASGV